MEHKEDLPVSNRVIVRKIDMHPKFSKEGGSYHYDMAILTLDRKVPLGPGAFPICLLIISSPKKYCPPSVPNADVQSDPLCSDAFIQTQ